LEVAEDIPHYRLFVGSLLLLSAVTAFACGLLAVVTLPHWRRMTYAGLMLAVPLVVGALITVAWHQEAPHLIYWALPYILAHGGAQALGGLSGIAIGRPVARLAVRIFLPPGLRPRLAYLWVVDGKPLPRA
jgi:hypothetical protein